MRCRICVTYRDMSVTDDIPKVGLHVHMYVHRDMDLD